MNVPLLDLVAQYNSIKDDVLAAMMKVVDTQQFIMGPAVPELETAIARLSHAKHGVGCASGTDALLLPLKALNLKPGDEVITTPFTFFATAGTIHNAGGTPVFVDIQPDTFNIDPAAVKRAITPRTRAIVPVHLYGQMADMLELMQIARPLGVKVIEDAAQAIGARRKMDGEWRVAGELGWVTGYSFFPSKNLGAWGDGGMMVTSDDAAADRLRRLRLHGGAEQYHHDEVGTTPPTIPRRWPRCGTSRRPSWIRPTSTSFTSTRCAPSVATRCRRISRRKGSGTPCTIRSRCIANPVLRTSVTRMAACPRRSRRLARQFRCRSTRSSPARSWTG